MDRISYAHQTDENKKNAVVYIHGGGFIVCRSEHTSHGAVPFVRNSKFQTAYFGLIQCPSDPRSVTLCDSSDCDCMRNANRERATCMSLRDCWQQPAAVMNRKDILNPILNV